MYCVSHKKSHMVHLFNEVAVRARQEASRYAPGKSFVLSIGSLIGWVGDVDQIVAMPWAGWSIQPPARVSKV